MNFKEMASFPIQPLGTLPGFDHPKCSSKGSCHPSDFPGGGLSGEGHSKVLPHRSLLRQISETVKTASKENFDMSMHEPSQNFFESKSNFDVSMREPTQNFFESTFFFFFYRTPLVFVKVFVFCQSL